LGTLYFLTPFLVMGGGIANRPLAAPSRVDERRLGEVARSMVGLVGLLGLAQGIVMFVAPAQVVGPGRGR